MKTSLFLLLLTLSTTVFSQNITYEYISIVQNGDFIYETKSGDEENFETINFKKEYGREYLNYTPLLKRIEKYEKEGYEVFSNSLAVSGAVSPTNYILMRRKKQD